MPDPDDAPPDAAPDAPLDAPLDAPHDGRAGLPPETPDLAAPEADAAPDEAEAAPPDPPPPPDPVRAALVAAVLPHVPFDGWSERAFRAAAADAGIPLEAARASAPRGALDLAAEWHREGDRAMLRRLQAADLGAMRTRERVAFAIKARLDAMDAREALRRSLALFALPGHAALGARLLWDTADAIWTALGDGARDGNWYSKRATLAAVLASVALYRVGDDSPDGAPTRAFVDRRIADVMAFERWKAGSGGPALLRPLARSLAWALARVPAPAPSPGLPGRR